jgi:hypothetical protein
MVNLSDFHDMTGIAARSECRMYEALSYVWGDPTNTTQITCDSGILQITCSLESLLRRFRYAKQDRILWADGVCINQRDVEERAQQVSLMGLIYWKARKVLVWLGEDDEKDERWKAHCAFRIMRKFSRLEWTNNEVVSEFQEYGIEAIQRGDDADDWEALRQLLNRKWFTRVWVVQELGLAQDATIRCGDCTLELDDLHNFLQKLLVRAPMFSTYYGLNLTMLRLAWSYYRSTRGNVRIELGNDPAIAESFCGILHSARSLECTDPRDLVYAFLGHPAAFKQHPLDSEPYMWYPRNYYQQRRVIIEPDYSEDTTSLDVYFRVAYTLIEDHGAGLTVLQQVGHNAATIEDQFPSWVPRWNLHHIFGFPKLNSALSRFSLTPIEIDTDGDDSSIGLKLKAALLDTVYFHGQTPAPHNFAIPPTDFAAQFSSMEAGTFMYNPVEDLYRNLLELRSSLPNPHLNDDQSFAAALTAGLTTDEYGDDALVEDSNRFRHFQDYCAYRHVKAANIIASGLAADHPIDDIGNDDEYYRNVAEGDANRYLTLMQHVAPLRAFFGTYDGRLGLGPRIIRGGDQVWLAMGSQMPFVFRPLGDGTFKIIGQAYLHGALRGETAIDLIEDTFEVVTLV